MRRVAKLSAACIASAALALTATACGSTSSENESGSTSSGDGKGVKVGLAFDVGGRGDRSFNDSAARGVDKAKKEFGGELRELTAKTSDTEADREQRLSDLADAGYNPIIGVGYAYAASMTKVAAKYPKTTFGIVDSVVNAKNVDSITFTEEQGLYLAGVAAALKTKSNHVGFIGGVDVPLIKSSRRASSRASRTPTRRSRSTPSTCRTARTPPASPAPTRARRPRRACSTTAPTSSTRRPAPPATARSRPSAARRAPGPSASTRTSTASRVWPSTRTRS